MSRPSSSNPPPAGPAFEEAMARLDEIVDAMEGERMPLEEMVARYEEGVRLLALCRGRLESARRRVELIQTSADEEAAATLEAFEPGEATEPAAAKPSPAKRRSSRTPAAAEDASSGDDDEIRLF
ncbi:MAG: exodeoxyribonuclease VII small subunit [Verrucomicrobiales bacterium]|nr:exodeoxyribonuclease VII small subunit [Verrucomicrobiales bacterium]